MARPQVSVREATDDDVPALLEMWGELREVGGRFDRAVPTPDAVLARLREAREQRGTRVVVAAYGREIAGMAVLTSECLGPLVEAPTVHLHYLHVREAYRRKGIGHALVAFAAAFAEETGAEHVVTSVFPQQRDTQRFFARLGFGPMVVRRVAPVSLLRRKLAADRQVHSGIGPMSGLLSRRRSARVRVAAATMSRAAHS